MPLNPLNRLLKQTAKERMRGVGIADTDTYTYITSGIGNPKRKRSFLRKA